MRIDHFFLKFTRDNWFFKSPIERLASFKMWIIDFGMSGRDATFKLFTSSGEKQKHQMSGREIRFRSGERLCSLIIREQD